MFSQKQIQRIKKKETPFYLYDLKLLNNTLIKIKHDAGVFNIHYALKANSNPFLLKLIKEAGLGADCVSGNEVKQAIKCGFSAKEIVFAGVGKTDKEITFALEQNIFCFNVESVSEISVINQLATKLNKKASIALRLNPNVDARTHKYITTGLYENKFGINPHELNEVIKIIQQSLNINLVGIHFHIGSQITSLAPFQKLCIKVNEINDWFYEHGIKLQLINLGGGLGINYNDPDGCSIVDFKSYFDLFRKHLKLHSDQKVHFELGRSIVAQCGSLIAKVVHIKKGINTNFAILDAGMTELLRPALYDAYHKIENISSESDHFLSYDIVGPICESSDCFGRAIMLPETKRGDILAIRSTGAYGESMALNYNLRKAASKLYLNK